MSSPSHEQEPYDAGWHVVSLDGRNFLQSEFLNRFATLRHLFTLRGFNMSPSSGPDRAAAPMNWESACAALEAPPQCLAAGRQVHGTHIAKVTHSVAETDPLPLFEDTDALITADLNQPLMAFSADCPLLLLHEPRRRLLAVAHSGWRGTLDGMPRRLVARLCEEWDASAANLVAAVSPSAGNCCYEVQDDVGNRVRSETNQAGLHLRERDGRATLDLGGLIREQLIDAGIEPDAVHLPTLCSICDRRLYSYRREGAGCGHAALIAFMPARVRRDNGPNREREGEAPAEPRMRGRGPLKSGGGR